MGLVEVFTQPVVLDGVRQRLERIPALGEHTDAILRELGYDAPAIAALHASGAA
jgi:crotonobetainyl-CoA:carnitine CoA-transferase CaiB-like acyl-CoA transferase